MCLDDFKLWQRKPKSQTDNDEFSSSNLRPFTSRRESKIQFGIKICGYN